VAKMLEIRRCIECWRVCDFRVGDQYPLPTDCPLDEAPAPYSAENPPKENDLVLVQLEDGEQIGFVECASGKHCNVRLAYSHPSEPVTEHFMAKELRLHYRPPSGATT